VKMPTFDVHRADQAAAWVEEHALVIHMALRAVALMGASTASNAAEFEQVLEFRECAQWIFDNYAPSCPEDHNHNQEED
jgi:hypothetical protein